MKGKGLTKFMMISNGKNSVNSTWRRNIVAEFFKCLCAMIITVSSTYIIFFDAASGATCMLCSSNANNSNRSLEEKAITSFSLCCTSLLITRNRRRAIKPHIPMIIRKIHQVFGHNCADNSFHPSIILAGSPQQTTVSTRFPSEQLPLFASTGRDYGHAISV